MTGRWSAQDEIKLFQAMKQNKPVGVHKHFAIINIAERLNATLDRHVTISQLWAYMAKLYDIKALDEFETLPFPNDVCDFHLPENDFPETISEIDSESDQRQSVADSLDLEGSTDAPPRSVKSRMSEKASVEDSTPRRAPKRTRAAAQHTDTPSHSKRRRV